MRVKVFVFLLSILLCAAISLVVIVHSIDYLNGFLDQDIALLIAVVIELAYVSYSILGAVSGRWELTDKLLKSFLFFLSIVPATMAVSQESRAIVVEQATRQAPAAPVKPTGLVTAIDDRIAGIDAEITSLRNYKNSYDINLESRTWYAFQDQKRIDALVKERNLAVQERIKLEQDWAERDNAYQAQLQTYQSESSVDSYTIFFNFASLAWTLSFIIIMQFLNGRLSRNCALILTQGFNEGSEKTVEEGLNDLVNNTTTEKQRPAVHAFLKQTGINNLSDLKKLLSDGFEKKLENLSDKKAIVEEVLVWLGSVHQMMKH